MDRETIRLGLILCAVTLGVSVLLAFANGITAPLIEQRKRADEENALRQVLQADSYEKTGLPQGAGALVQEIYTATTEGRTAGWCVMTAPSGYAGAMRLLVGVTADGKVSGVTVTDMNETPGLGTLAKEKKFTGQFVGKSGALRVEKDGGDIAAVSGATITSRAVTNGVNQSIEAAKLMSGGAK